MDIYKLTITELKALGYELILELERIQQNLRVVQARINELSQGDEPVAGKE